MAPVIEARLAGNDARRYAGAQRCVGPFDPDAADIAVRWQAELAVVRDDNTAVVGLTRLIANKLRVKTDRGTVDAAEVLVAS